MKHFCPECGSKEYRTLEDKHFQCELCFQEFFEDVDYSDIISSSLKSFVQFRKLLKLGLRYIKYAKTMLGKRHTKTSKVDLWIEETEKCLGIK